MKLFAGLRGQGADAELDTPAAVMVPIVAAMVADGRIDDDELEYIHFICGSTPIFERNSKADNEYLINRSMRLIEDHGIEGMCRKAANLLSPALKETAFVHAASVVFSDGHLGRLEKETIENMIAWLEINPERARMFVEAVSVMRHPATA